MPDSSPENIADDKIVDNSGTASAATETTNSDVQAESSTAPAGTMLDAVQAAIKPKEESPASKEPGPPADTATPDPAAETDADVTFTPDELKGLHAKTRERFVKLTSRLANKDKVIADLQPKVAEFDKLLAFQREQNLSNEDLVNTFRIAAMLRNDPKAARAALLPIVQRLNTELGEVIPAELQQRVDQGYLTEEDARALARAGADARLSQQQLVEQRQRADEQRQREATETHVRSTLDAAANWERQQAAKDPDWHLKREAVADGVELAITREATKRGAPWFPNATELAKLSEDVLKGINERFKRFAPRPQHIDPPLTNGASSRATAAPQNILDIVRAQVGAG